MINIDEIISLSTQKKDVEKRLSLMADKSTLTDLSLIKTIYENHFRSAGNDRNNRLSFVFVILLLYDPSFFAKGRIKRGLRKEIAKCLSVNAETVVSNYSAFLLWEYEHYTDFKQNVTNIYNNVYAELIA